MAFRTGSANSATSPSGWRIKDLAKWANLKGTKVPEIRPPDRAVLVGDRFLDLDKREAGRVLRVESLGRGDDSGRAWMVRDPWNSSRRATLVSIERLTTPKLFKRLDKEETR